MRSSVARKVRVFGQAARALAFGVGTLLLPATGAGAATVTLVDVSGPANASQGVNAGQAAAVGFSIDAPQTGVSIGADLLCIDCSGALYLMKGLIGPLAELSNVIAARAFSVAVSPASLFTGLSLDSGKYYLVLALTGHDGAAVWRGSYPATVATDAGSTMGLNFFAETIDVSEPYRSPFLVITEPGALHFKVTAEDGGGDGGGDPVAPVPLPAAGWLLAIALAGVAAASRYRSRTA